MEPLTEGRKANSGKRSTRRRLCLAATLLKIIRTWPEARGPAVTFALQQEVEAVTGAEWPRNEVRLALLLLRRRRLVFCTGHRFVAAYHAATTTTTKEEPPCPQH